MNENEEFPQTETEEVNQAQEAQETAPPSRNPLIDKLMAEADDLRRKWYAVTAEYENYRKRTAATRASAYAEGRADVVKGLFDIADNLELALMSCSDEKTLRGIEMVMKAFERLLADEKITRIDPLGEVFSADTMEAVFAVDAEEGEQSGTVKQVFRKGYEQNGKILRFAQVSVIK